MLQLLRGAQTRLLSVSKSQPRLRQRQIEQTDTNIYIWEHQSRRFCNLAEPVETPSHRAPLSHDLQSSNPVKQPQNDTNHHSELQQFLERISLYLAATSLPQDDEILRLSLHNDLPNLMIDHHHHILQYLATAADTKAKLERVASIFVAACQIHRRTLSAFKIRTISQKKRKLYIVDTICAFYANLSRHQLKSLPAHFESFVSPSYFVNR